MPNEQDFRTSSSPAPRTKSSVGHWLLAAAMCLLNVSVFEQCISSWPLHDRNAEQPIYLAIAVSTGV